MTSHTGAAPRTCAIATPHTAATEAAADCVARGGNALDAALAAAVTLCVVYPHNTSLGGDLFALVHSPDGTVTSVNASGPAGRAADVEAVRARHGGRMPTRGTDTVTVPGAVAGLGRLHRLGARLPWGAHFEAARHLAAGGVDVAPSLARAVDEELDLLRVDPGLRAVFLPEGRPARTGDVLVQPRLARTLARLADGGPDELYRGALSRQIVSTLRSQGSSLEERDFALFEATVEAGVSRPCRGVEVWTAAPNSQGFLLLEILQALDLAGCPDPLGEDAGFLSALFCAANRDRDRALADPAAMTETVDALLDAGRWSDLVAGLRKSVSRAPSAPDASDAPDAPDAPDPTGVPRMPGAGHGDTVAVVAADADGWGVSLIQSLFHSFGAGILDERSGIVFHDRGALFSLDGTSPNVLAPGKRPAHTLMPVLVHDGGRLRFVMGTMGGRAQPQIHAQVLLRLLDGDDPVAAVSAPRWIVESVGEAAEGGDRADRGVGRDLALVEAGVPAAARAAIAARAGVLDLAERDEATGHAQVVEVSALEVSALEMSALEVSALDTVSAGHAPTIGLRAGSDPRADGAAVVVPMPPRPGAAQTRP